jgi:uncharacterized caspase-like protein
MPFANGYALVIGVGQYQHMGKYNVPIAIKDAEAVGAALQDASRCGYPAAQVTLLTKEKATRAAVLSALDALADQLNEADTLFLFFVGHGVYGTDGNYYLTSYDTQLQNNQVVAGTGVSESDLLDGLRKIKAKRMLLVINACHSGALSPSFDVDVPLDSEAPPSKLAEALLSTGEGRITITACRPEQKSWIGLGDLSIFSAALVNGLRGGAPNSKGYISAFGLYEYLYQEAKDAAAELGNQQEPELTVIKGVGPFPVALFRGASAPGDFDVSADVPAGTAARQVSPEKSRRSYSQYQATLNGDGAIAQGPGATAVGKGGILIKGDVGGNFTVGNNNTFGDK